MMLPVGLTNREIQVLDALVRLGMNKLIADELGVSIKTVEAHTAAALKKANLKSRVLLAVWWDRYRRAPA